MGKPMGIQAVQFSDQDFKAALEASVSEGRPLLIENVEETIDPILDPILEQKFVRRGARRWVELKRVAYDYHYKKKYCWRSMHP